MDLSKPRRDTELHLVGTMMCYPDTIGVVTGLIGAGDVYDKSAQAIFKAVVDLWGRGEKVVPTAVTAELPDGIDTDDVFYAYGAAGSGEHAPVLANRAYDGSTRRELIAAAQGIIKAAREDDREIVDVLGSAQGWILALSLKGGEEDLGEVIRGVYRRSEEAKESGQPGIPWAWRKLTDMTGGKKAGEFIVIASRPSVGKSALIKNDIIYALRHTKERIALFSPEMRKPEVIVRMLAEISGLDGNRIARGDLSPEQWVQYNLACEELTDIAKGRLVFDDSVRPSVGKVISTVRQEERNGGIGTIYGDYAQRMKMNSRLDGATAQLSSLVEQWFDMAGMLGVATVLLAQVHRDTERGGQINKPAASNIKGSGTFEEAADTLILPHRESREATTGSFLLAKQRNGPTGEIPVRYDGKTTSFKEV